jgi:3-oxoadipate enol-lactonase
VPRAHINGQSIYYEDTGGDGPPVVFSHGFLMDREMFAENIAALVPEYRCITWDQRGFGKTGPVDTAFTYWDSAHDLFALLDRLGIARAALVGMSQGGFVSLRAALLAGGRVSALALIDTRSGTDAPETIAAFGGLDAEWRANGARNVKSDLGKLLGIAHAPEPWFAKWDRMGTEDVHFPIAALAGRDDITSRLSAIVAPSLVIHGDADVAIALEHGAALCAALPNAERLFTVPGAGHAANMQCPDLVNAALLSFLGRHLLRGSSSS